MKFTHSAACVEACGAGNHEGAGVARSALWVAAAAVMLAGVAGCQPGGGGKQAGASSGNPPPVTQAERPKDEPPLKPNEVVRERIVYVDRPGASADEVLAKVGRQGEVQEIKFSEVRDLLLKAYGLNATLNVVQLKLAQAEVRKRNLNVSPADVKSEVDETLAQMFPDAGANEYPNLLSQLLQRQKLSRAEFDLIMEINANLRKIASSQLEPEVKEEVLREAYNALYGETVRVRHIALANLQEVAEAKRRLAGGTPFEVLAKEMSKNALTRDLGGELPPFSRASTDVAQSFKDVAFGMKEGEVSDAVQAEGYYHLIQVIRKIPPKAVKFEDVKDGIARDLRRKATDAAVKQFRASLGDEAVRTLKFMNADLNQQWNAKSETAAKNLPPGQGTGQ